MFPLKLACAETISLNDSSLIVPLHTFIDEPTSEEAYNWGEGAHQRNCTVCTRPSDDQINRCPYPDDQGWYAAWIVVVVVNYLSTFH